MDTNNVRAEIRESANHFRKNWLEFARRLADIHTSGIFKSWGYKTIVDFAREELKLKKETVFKLLNSYTFLKEDFPDREESAPPLETINALRKLKPKIEDPKVFSEIAGEALEKEVTPQTIAKKASKFIIHDEKDDSDASEESESEGLTSLSDQEIKRLSHFLRKVEELIFKIGDLPEHVRESMKDIREFIDG